MSINKKIREQIEKKAAEKLLGMDSFVDRALENSILSLIGLEKGHRGEYEIDHCNGRNSVLIDAFRDRAEGHAKKLASSLKLDANEMKAYRLAFRNEYSSQIHRAIKKAAADRAENDAEEFVSKIKVDINKYLDM